MELQTRNCEVFAPSDHGGKRANSGRTAGAKTKNRNAHESVAPPVLLTKAEEKRLWRLMLGVEKPRPDEVLPPNKELLPALQYVNEMRRGKPFVASNPRAQRTQGDDNRLLIAINNMLPGGETLTAKAKGRKKRK